MNRFYILLFAILLSTITSFSQENSEVIEEKKPAAPYSLSGIREAGEETEKLVKKALELGTDSTAISEFDSAFVRLKRDNLFRYNEDSLYVEYEGVTLWLLRSESKYWREYEESVRSIESKINDRYDELSEILDKLGELNVSWKLTEKMADTIEVSENVAETITKYVEETNRVREVINTHLDGLVAITMQISKEIKQIDYIQQTIEDLRNEQAENIFSQDALPLLQALKTEKVGFVTALKIGLKSDYELLREYLKENSKDVAAHFALILLFIAILFAMRVHFFKQGLDKLDEYSEAIAVMKKPVVSGLALGLIFSGMMYTDFPVVLVDVIVIATVLPAIVLLPKLINTRLKYFAYFIIILVLFEKTSNALVASQSEQRLFILIASLIAIAGFVYALLPKSGMGKALRKSKARYIPPIMALFVVLLLAAVIFNLRGSYQLAILLSGGVLHSLLVGIAVFIAVRVTQAIVTVIVGTGFYGKVNVLLRHKGDAKKWLFTLLKLAGFYFWIRSMLSGFALLSPFIDAYYEFLEQSWQFGEITLSMNNIVDFIAILILFWAIANALHLIIKDEILTRFDVRKGLPLAFAVLSRYFILFLGFVLAMSAAGISLSKLSLLLGALGVGIGFGLQNIVSNLVSGLVILFERPIHIGDTVTAGTLEGEVIEIGLRSSRIRTWEGAEVIVPNNNLVANEVTNWTYSDRRRRVERMVYVSTGPRPREVKKVIDHVITNQEGLLKVEQAQGYFLGTENNALKFRVLMWMDNNILTNPSEVLLNLYDALEANGMKPFIPVHKVIISDETNSSKNPLVIGDENGDLTEEELKSTDDN